jgi:hypothetical protein
MRVLHTKIECLHANNFTGAAWAFPIDDIAKSSATKTSNQNGKKQIDI